MERERENNEENNEGFGIAKVVGAVAGLAAVAWGISSLLSGSTSASEQKEEEKMMKTQSQGNYYTTRPQQMLSVQEKMKHWTAPPSGYVKINVDGSSANPGLSGVGGLIRDAKGDWILGFAKGLGDSDVLDTELQAIHEGLLLCWKLGYRKVIVESDSENAVELINGPARPRHPNSTIISACSDLLNRNWDCSLCHIYREANKCADRLAANSGTSVPSDLKVLRDQPPDQRLEECLSNDIMSLPYV